jgi:hypothetical protein
MENGIVKVKEQLTAVEIRAQVNLIQEVMQSVMKQNVHYGVIPGCKLPSLYKAGAEKIAVTFRLAVRTLVDNLSTPDEAKYRVTAEAYNGDKFLGSATGTCSSNEDKYKWRAPVCQEEFDATAENKRREKWVKGYQGGKPTAKKQVRTEPADIDNTILQMADKRAYVAVVRKVTAASDVFTQDIEDLPEEVIEGVVREDVPVKPNIEMPKPKAQTEQLTHTCLQCQVGITDKVNEYSIKRFGRSLCFDCQKGAQNGKA